jgi:hypothetical protein
MLRDHMREFSADWQPIKAAKGPPARPHRSMQSAIPVLPVPCSPAMPHRTDPWPGSRARQRTKLANTIRAHMAEIGMVAPIGRKGLELLLEIIRQDEAGRIPDASRSCLRMLADQFSMVKAHNPRT